MDTMTKKITKATFKAFVNKNRENLFILVKSDFDGMVDGVVECKGTPQKARPSDLGHSENTLGINGVWLVGRSRDYFSHYEDEVFRGIKVYNCCGSFIVGVIK